MGNCNNCDEKDYERKHEYDDNVKYINLKVSLEV